MSEYYHKSKEEIALELFKILVTGEVRSGSNDRPILGKLAMDIPDITKRNEFCLQLFEACLATMQTPQTSKNK